MIQDQAVLSDIHQQWAVVREFCSPSHRSYAVAAGAGVAYINETPPESFYNLPLLLAYSVLDQVLDQLILERVFACKDRRLGVKMSASKGSLAWKDFATVDVGRERRNEVAHKAALFDRAICLKFIDAIEAELRGWGIVI